MYVGERDSVGLRSGYGIMEYPEGGEYRGEWRNDLPFGCGVERLPPNPIIPTRQPPSSPHANPEVINHTPYTINHES